MLRSRLSRSLAVLLVGALASVGCGGGADVSLATKTTPQTGTTTLALGDAHAQTPEGESLWLHLDGSFEYRSAAGAPIVRGRLTSDTIFDSLGHVIATIAADGKITVQDSASSIDQRVDPSGTYSIHGKPMWTIDGDGNLVEARGGSVVLRTSAVPSQLRRALVLAQMSVSVLFRRGFKGAASP